MAALAAWRSARPSCGDISAICSGPRKRMMQPIWTPSPERIAEAEITAFIAEVNRRWGYEIKGYSDLHRFSIERPERFWLAVWDFCGVIAEHRGDTVLADAWRAMVPGGSSELRAQSPASSRRCASGRCPQGG